VGIGHPAVLKIGLSHKAGEWSLGKSSFGLDKKDLTKFVNQGIYVVTSIAMSNSI
jgi:hypothetical protein